MKRVEEGAKAKPKTKRASRASKPAAKAKKTANAGTKAKSAPKAGAKAKPGASEAKPIKVRKGEKVAVVLSGGNPRIAKADGDAPVQAYIAGMPGWKRDLGKRLDALIVRNVRKAVKWNSPLYGIEGQGWFLGFHTFTHYVKVAFFRGTSLRPVPPRHQQGQGHALHRHPRRRRARRGADGELGETGRPLRHQLIALKRRLHGRIRLTNHDRWFFVQLVGMRG
jgi:hypothetical protein